MSKPIPSEGVVRLSAIDQVRYFAELYCRAVTPAKAARFAAHCARLGLHFTSDELTVLAALDTPEKVQQFMNTQLYYNNDHASADLEETAMPPRRVLQTGMAHCFEGAMFAYTVDYLHGHDPRLVLLEAIQDSEHNLVVCRDAQTGLFGCNAHSRFPGLDGRRAGFATIRALSESYIPFYYSDRTNDPTDLTLVAYSDEYDLIARYGTQWMASEKPLWDIYYTYIDDSWRFHYFSGDPDESHPYPVVRALKENWIRIDAQGKPFVSAGDLPEAARELWHAFWREFGANDGRRPQGRAREIEGDFMRVTGTTPIDLDDNASDFQYYLDAGYRVDQLLKRQE